MLQNYYNWTEKPETSSLDLLYEWGVRLKKPRIAQTQARLYSKDTKKNKQDNKIFNLLFILLEWATTEVEPLTNND